MVSKWFIVNVAPPKPAQLTGFRRAGGEAPRAVGFSI
jgi:hypothetical protein